MKFLWSLTIIGCMMAGLTVIDAMLVAKSAPQQGAAAALAAAMAVVPYCLARAFQQFDGNVELRKIRKLLEQQQQPGAPRAAAGDRAA